MSPNRKSSLTVILMTLALLAALLLPIACDDGGDGPDGRVVPATVVPMLPVTPEGSVGS